MSESHRAEHEIIANVKEQADLALKIVLLSATEYIHRTEDELTVKDRLFTAISNSLTNLEEFQMDSKNIQHAISGLERIYSLDNLPEKIKDIIKVTLGKLRTKSISQIELPKPYIQ